jgi:hypothetical protein
VIELLAISAVVGLASLTQIVSGFGSALIAVPLLALVVGAKTAVVGTTLLFPLISLRIVTRSHADVKWRAASTAFAASLAGMPIGLVVISVADDRVLQASIAVVVFLFTALLWRGSTIPEHGPVVDAGVGFASGVLATSTGTSGPPLVIALQARGLEPSPFRATLSAVFLAQSVASVAAFAIVGRIDGEAMRVFAAGLPALLLATFAGERAFSRIEPRRFRSLVFALLCASAAAALAGALVA